jgi:F-type H+-transporting ATPase subunit epsilon
MVETIQLEIVSPEKLILSQSAEMVVVPGALGDFAALRHHAPLISTIRTGFIDIYQAGLITNRVFIIGGFAEVSSTHLIILAEDATLLNDISPSQVEERLNEAKVELETATDDIARHEAKEKLAIATLLNEALAKN